MSDLFGDPIVDKVREQPEALSVESQQIIGGLAYGRHNRPCLTQIISIELATALGVIATALIDDDWSPPVSQAMVIP